MKLPTANEMQALDACAIQEFGIPGAVLMENAGVATVRIMEQTLGRCDATFACIFIGPGNNGGDGLVIGRHLHQRGCEPIFFFLQSPENINSDAAINLAIVQKLKLPYHIIDTKARVQAFPVLYKQIESRGQRCYAIVDALFGTGLTRAISGHFEAMIQLINNRDFAKEVPVIAVDCPSGMDADSGKKQPISIRANHTITYGFAKPGHYLHDSHLLTGTLDVVDIGIPAETLKQVPVATDLLTPLLCRNMVRPLVRTRSSHKGSHGHLLILAGSTGKSGAAILSAMGGMRGGSGLVTLCVPANLNCVMENSLIEAMTIPMENSKDFFVEADTESITHAAKDKKTLVIGPGLGTHEQTQLLVRKLYRELTSPMVVDADALNILAMEPKDISKNKGIRILTPHPGEMSRLLDWSVEDIQNNRLEAAKEACKKFNSGNDPVIIVLKGAGTVISTADGTSLINSSGNPGMATGGMGDVLSGLIGALLCQSLPAKEAAAAAVHLHGAAADRLFEKTGPGYTASEVAEQIPATLHSLLHTDYQ